MVFIVCERRSLRSFARWWLCAIALPLAATAVAAEPLSLQEALAVASQRSGQVSAQRHGVEAARQAVVPARELPDPKLFFGIENLPVTTSDAFSLTRDFMTMRKIGVMQEFSRSQKRELKGQVAERTAAREEALLVDTQAALRRDVATAWLQSYYAERLSATVAEQIEEARLQREAASAGLKSNRIQPGDLLAIEVNLQTLIDRRAQFDRDAARARAMLSRWLGPAAERPLSEFTLAGSPGDLAALSAHIEQHPHVQSLDRQIEIAQAEAQLAQAAKQPDWSLEVAYAQRGPGFSNMLSVQVSIDLPILQSRRKNPEIASKYAQVQQARELRDEAIRAHVAEARAALTDWQAASERVRRFDESVLPLADERIKTALAAYRGGKGELGTVLEARRAQLDLKLQRLQLLSEQMLAYAQVLYFTHAENGQ
jgi:outer membrane protein TolC